MTGYTGRCIWMPATDPWTDTVCTEIKTAGKTVSAEKGLCR